MNVEATATGTEIAVAIPQGDKLPVFFSTPAMVDAMLDEIEAKARAFVPDLSTKTSRARIASAAADVASTKAAMDRAGLSLTADMRATIGTVNAERSKIKDRLDALKAEVRKPLTDWEKAEVSRILGLQIRLAAIDAGRADALCPSAQIASVLAEIEQIEIDASWQEFTAEAGIRKNGAVNQLRDALAVARDREEQFAELARLRREAAERAQAEAQAAVAKAQEEAARVAEIAAQQAAAVAAEAEAKRLADIERDKIFWAERAADAARQQERAEAAERQRQTERDAAELVAKAEREKQAEIDKAVRLAREQAAQEQAKKDEAARAARVQAAREADEKHRATVKLQIIGAVVGLAPDVLADALMAGSIPHCRVEF